MIDQLLSNLAPSGRQPGDKITTENAPAPSHVKGKSESEGESEEALSFAAVLEPQLLGGASQVAAALIGTRKNAAQNRTPPFKDEATPPALKVGRPATGANLFGALGPKPEVNPRDVIPEMPTMSDSIVPEHATGRRFVKEEPTKPERPSPRPRSGPNMREHSQTQNNPTVIGSVTLKKQLFVSPTMPGAPIVHSRRPMTAWAVSPTATQPPLLAQQQPLAQRQLFAQQQPLAQQQDLIERASPSSGQEVARSSARRDEEVTQKLLRPRPTSASTSTSTTAAPKVDRVAAGEPSLGPKGSAHAERTFAAGQRPSSASHARVAPATTGVVANVPVASAVSRMLGGSEVARQLSVRAPGRFSASEKGAPVRARDLQKWAAREVVSTVDESWNQLVPAPKLEATKDVKLLAAPASRPSLEAGATDRHQNLVEASSATPSIESPTNEVAGGSSSEESGSEVILERRQAAVPQGVQSIVEGYRVLTQPAQALAQAQTQTQVMQAIVDRVQSLFEGMGLKGGIKLGPRTAEIIVESPSLGKVAASVSVDGSVVDLTIAAQAAAKLGDQIESLRALLQDAGLDVGTLKTVPFVAGGQFPITADNRKDKESREPPTAAQTGSVLALEEGADSAGTELSRTRRRAHHGQVRVTA